jgi:hypothetical protein
MTNFKVIDGGKGSGPEDPMLEQRVEALEGDMKDVKSSLSRIEITLARIDATIAQMPKAGDFARLSSEVAEIKGKVSNLPTWINLIGIVISTWMAGAGIVLAVIKLAK